LVEEYDAIAAAIRSALRKFAPSHLTRVVPVLSEAVAVAIEIKPDLVIIDLDPPQLRTIESLQRMSSECGDARVLAIASNLPKALAAEGSGPDAIHFIDKPFELAHFGAAVQTLMGPWMKATSGDSRGRLRDLNLRDLITVECVSGASAVLEVQSAQQRSGEIHFHHGKICHAVMGNLGGVDALEEILRWRGVRIRESGRPRIAPRTIERPWQEVFVEALGKIKPTIEEQTALAGRKTVTEKEGKTIVVIDDAGMLLLFVDEVLANSDPTFRIVTAITGSEGLLRVREINPDLVLLDYSLPDLRGDELCARLLRDEATANIPVVMMSGHVPEMMAAADRYSNVVATIIKPFNASALISLVQRMLACGPLSPG